jgi:hypothetical protein
MENHVNVQTSTYKLQSVAKWTNIMEHFLKNPEIHQLVKHRTS